MEYEDQVNVKCKSEDSARLFRTLCSIEGWTYEHAIKALVWLKIHKPDSVSDVPDEIDEFELAKDLSFT